MGELLEVFWREFQGYARYLAEAALHPSWTNWIYVLLGVSILVYALELAFPWRRDQPRVRRDFWLDGFYCVFNFFLFNLIGFQAVAAVAAYLVTDARAALGLPEDGWLSIASWPAWAQMLVLFVVRDLVHYFVHRLLHRVPWLWRVHKVHHSVRVMGFAAHLRFHPMETVVYRTLEYLPLGIVGFGPVEFFAVHLVALSIGHLNHANVRIPLGPLKYVFNSAPMHIWHHAKELPPDRRYGANFGISLSVWDFLFRTVHWPGRGESGKDIELGFDDVESYPSGFLAQLARPFRRRG